MRRSWKGGGLITRRVAYNDRCVDQIPIEEDGMLGEWSFVSESLVVKTAC